MCGQLMMVTMTNRDKMSFNCFKSLNELLGVKLEKLKITLDCYHAQKLVKLMLMCLLRVRNGVIWQLLSSSGSRPCLGQLQKTPRSKETLSHSQVSRSGPRD